MSCRGKYTDIVARVMDNCRDRAMWLTDLFFYLECSQGDGLGGGGGVDWDWGLNFGYVRAAKGLKP